MIKVNKNDSIVDIVTKIKANTEKEVVLEFPFGHPVMHNSTSLKVLKSNTGKRDLVIITSDKTARGIGRSLGIKYEHIDTSDIVGYNYSFFEYFLYTIRSYGREIKDLFFSRNKGASKYSRNTDSKLRYFVVIMFVCIFLLLFVFYFAVNKTYIYITPKIEVKSKAKNFVFTEMGDEELALEDNLIRLKKIEKTISITEKFGASGISPDSVSHARGRVTLFNETLEKIDLVENTRVQTNSGVVFLIEGGVSIPGAESSGTGEIIPGTVDVYAVSRNQDSDGQIVGTKANIQAGVEMFLPGLSENRDKIYAISSSEFSGANNDYERVLREEDIENAKLLLRGRIESEALKSVKEDIEKENVINNAQYEILGINDIIKYSEFDVYGVDNYEIGQKIDSFELSGTIKISTYSYNKGLLISKMKNDISNSILTNVEEILEINSPSLRITNILNTNENPFSIKATGIVEVFVIHNFLSKENSYVDRLKSVVAGLPQEEAEKLLLNNSRISNVQIDIKPFFMDNVSSIDENIIFRVEN